jgi:hexosaminidase
MLDIRVQHWKELAPILRRLQHGTKASGVELLTHHASLPIALKVFASSIAPEHPEGYGLRIDAGGISVYCRELRGLRCAVATLRQLFREYGRRLPRLTMGDWPDFERRGVMLDISRGRVPNLQTLLELVEHLADFKINEFQLYTEHTFAYRKYPGVWRGWGAITGAEIQTLDARCRELGIDLVPNQNSFGHLRYFLEYPPLKKLAEVQEPYESPDKTFVRYPTTLAPLNPGTLPFLRGLFDELLPHFSSRYFNVGCDETWDLGRGQSKTACEARGKGRVYVEFLKKIQREVKARKRRMMFWGDIILNHPELIRGLPRDAIALNWGYEAGHPFDKEGRLFADSKIPYYVCPGTSTWMSLIGRNDNAFVNLTEAAQAGKKHGAVGYLNTDWGDGGHPQPLAVSYPAYILGAALSWHASREKGLEERLLPHVLDRDIFHDATKRMAEAALGLGVAHRKLKFLAPNVTPLGTVVAAPLPSTRELTCRDGLKYYKSIPEKNIRAALDEIEAQRAVLYRARPANHAGDILAVELDMAARMAAQSCRIMLWQQALAAGKAARAKQLARSGIRELQEIERDFKAYWPLRNKGTTEECSAFLRWRMDDYRKGKLHF